VLLSSVLAGETASHEIELRPASWWRDHGVTLKYGCVATEIDAGRRELKIAGEESVAFSKLVLATGSAPLRLNVPGADLAGVHTFRDSRDVDLLLTLAARKKRVVVVGGGLLGLEAAYGLAKAGAPVTLIHLMDRLMERQLDAPAAELLKTLVERKGIGVLLNANTARLHGEKVVEGIELADGRSIEADAVIFAAGIRPNVALAKDAGISVNRGIVVDDQLQTDAADIFALGECAEHRGICYGLVEPAYEQARVLARHLAGNSVSYRGSVVATNLKVSGVAVFSAGDFIAADGAETIVLNDSRRGTYKKLVIANGRLTGAVLVGETQDALWYLELIRTRAPIAKIRGEMMFGRSLAIRSEAA
jgi:nitrite reductase (NADH) large subunit